MTNQSPEITTISAASTDRHSLEESLELDNRISLRRRLDRMINDPNVPIDYIIKLSAVLDRMEARHAATVKARTRDRELALAELRCAIQLRKIALEEAKLALKKGQDASFATSSPQGSPQTQPVANKSAQVASEPGLDEGGIQVPGASNSLSVATKHSSLNCELSRESAAILIQSLRGLQPDSRRGTPKTMTHP